MAKIQNLNSEFKVSDVSYSLQAFVEKLQSDLGLNNMIGLKDDYYISYRRMQDLFPQLSDTGDAIKVPISTTSDGGDGFIRYNNTSNQFEGYSSSNWQGLGGVTNIDQTTKITATEANKLEFYTVSNERMVIDENGNVGIGTTNPLAKLQVYGNEGLTISPEGTGARTAIIRLGSPYNSNHDAYCAKITSFNNRNDNYNSDLRFYTHDSEKITDTDDPVPDAKERMCITASGNVGIGTTAPSSD